MINYHNEVEHDNEPIIFRSLYIVIIGIDAYL